MLLKSVALHLVLVSCAMTACASIPYFDESRVDLDPPDTRPAFSVAVADSGESALLAQELGLKPLYIRGDRLFFHEAPGVLESLQRHGYMPQKEDSYEVYRRVVRVKKKGTEQELLRLGVGLINRENAYWIVEGSLGRLIALERLGYAISAVAPHEPRPREVRITVRSRDDVVWLNALQVDIYTVRESKEGIVVNGGAFDHQIDRIREKNLKIELLEAVRKGEPR